MEKMLGLKEPGEQRHPSFLVIPPPTRIVPKTQPIVVRHICESHLHSLCSLIFMLIRCQHYVRMVAGRLELSGRHNYRYYLMGQRIKYSFMIMADAEQHLSRLSLLMNHSLGY